MALEKPSASTTVLVTGASSGIGTEMARQLASRGHGVTLVARRADRLDSLAAELSERHKITATAIPCDLGDPIARAELIEGLRAGPALAGLCNNAGYGINGRFARNDADRERQMVELNVVALHDLTLRALPGMIERGTGAILNVASTAAFQPLPGFATYAATKAFVLSFSESLSTELSGTGVSCSALCPGPVKTEFAAVAGSTMSESLPDFAMVSAEEVARQAIDAMESGNRTAIPGMANQIQALLGRLAPRSLVLPLAGRVSKL
ncbi:MAG: SDR family oxidoreductase [Actinomycetes bacterium]